MYLREIDPELGDCCECGSPRVVLDIFEHLDSPGSRAIVFGCEQCGSFGAVGTGIAAMDVEEVSREFAKGRDDVRLEIERR